MAIRKPIVINAQGVQEELPAGDTLPGSGAGVSASVVTVDFGAAGGIEKVFNVALAGATPGQKVLATVSQDMPAGVAEDELEMDMLAVAGRVPSADLVRLTVASIRGPIRGQRNINILLG
jgi:hypothetical protein